MTNQMLTPLLKSDLPTNAQSDSWNLGPITPSSIDDRVAARVPTQSTTPLTRFTAFGNVLIGAAASSSLFFGGMVGAYSESATTIVTTYVQGAEHGTSIVRQGQRDTPHSDDVIREPAVLRMVDDLKGWLELPDSELSSLIGVSRRSVTNWRSGVAAYPSSSRRVTTVHALVGRLVESLGDAGLARLWLSAESEPGKTRLALLAEGETGIGRVLNEGANVFFSRPASVGLDSGLSDQETVRVVGTARAGSDPARSAPRRVRRPGSGSR